MTGKVLAILISPAAAEMSCNNLSGSDSVLRCTLPYSHQDVALGCSFRLIRRNILGSPACAAAQMSCVCRSDVRNDWDGTRFRSFLPCFPANLRFLLVFSTLL